MSDIKLRVAYPSSNQVVIDGHFGHAKAFVVYTISGNDKMKEVILPPKHEPGSIPKFLHDNNCNVIVASGMGAMAKQLFEQNGIEVILGAVGNIEESLNQLLEGSLLSTNTTCTHDHDHDCDH